jgi:DNA repair exonuclease SbcCD ATPase subunit
MKFLKLEILNLASLDKRDGEVINFEEGALGESTIFSIVGPTGSGKSTILDAICLALYNRAPRYPRQSGGKDKMEVYGTKDKEEGNRLSPTDGRNILSRGKKECYSKLTFLANDGSIYRAEWSVRFKTKKYEEAITALYRMVQKEGRQEEEVADWKDLPQIIGLDYDQFLRTVLIAQGSFANFLTAKVDERYALLEKLVGCEDMYSRIAEEIKQKKDDAIASYNEIKADFEAYEKYDLTPEELLALNQRIEELEEAEKKRSQELETVGKALAWYADEARIQANMDKYKVALDEAKTRLDAMKEQTERLALHDVTLPAVDLYKEKKSKEEALLQIANDLKKLSDEVEQKGMEIATEEKKLYVLKGEAEKASNRLAEQKPHINAARIIKAQLEVAKKNEEEKRNLLSKATKEQAKAKGMLDDNLLSVKKCEELLAQLQTKLDEYRLSSDKKKEELKMLVEEAVRVYEQVKIQLEGKNVEALQQAKERAMNCLQDLKDAIRIQQEWKEKEERKSKNEQEIKTLTGRNASIGHELGKLTIEALAKELETHRKTHTLLTSDNWKKHRLSLTEGMPCPLCGAKNHPYGQEELFQPVVTELEELIAEKQSEWNRQIQCEKSLTTELGRNKGTLESLEKHLAVLRVEVEKHQSEWDAIVEKHGDWRADEESLKGMVQPMEEALTHTQKELDEYNALYRQVEKLRALKEKEESRQKEYEKTYEMEWKKLEGQKTDATTALASEKGKTENLVAQWNEKKEAWNMAMEELAKVQESVSLKQKELKEKMGEKDPDAFELELADALANADAEVKKKERLIAEQKQQLAGYQGTIQAKKVQQQQDKETLSEKERLLTDWLSAYNAEESHVQELMLEDIAELYEATDDWEAVRKEKEYRNQIRISAETTYRNEVEAHLVHQSFKPSEDKETLENRKQELEVKDHSELIDAKARLQHYQQAKQAMGAMYERKQQTESVMKDWAAISEAIGGADGKTLRKIAQCYTLRFLIEHANAEIRKFNQRYELVQVKNSLGIRVIDHDRADDIRDTTSLSGGETFIVSLGLALGLSALSSRNISFQNLFIDEGFGTLDPDALSTVIDSLAMLQSSQGKKVGVISHTDTMSERITTQIRIVKNGNSGSSHIEVYP